VSQVMPQDEMTGRLVVWHQTLPFDN